MIESGLASAVRNWHGRPAHDAEPTGKMPVPLLNLVLIMLMRLLYRAKASLG